MSFSSPERPSTPYLCTCASQSSSTGESVDYADFNQSPAISPVGFGSQAEHPSIPHLGAHFIGDESSETQQGRWNLPHDEQRWFEYASLQELEEIDQMSKGVQFATIAGEFREAEGTAQGSFGLAQAGKSHALMQRVPGLYTPYEEPPVTARLAALNSPHLSTQPEYDLTICPGCGGFSLAALHSHPFEQDILSPAMSPPTLNRVPDSPQLSLAREEVTTPSRKGQTQPVDNNQAAPKKCAISPLSKSPTLGAKREGSFECDMCHKTKCKREGDLKRHQTKHCRERFNIDRKPHAIRVHALQCSVCEFKHERKDKMQEHCQKKHQQSKGNEQFS